MKLGRANPLGSSSLAFCLLFVPKALDITQTCVHNIENKDFYIILQVVNNLQGYCMVLQKKRAQMGALAPNRIRL